MKSTIKIILAAILLWFALIEASCSTYQHGAPIYGKRYTAGRGSVYIYIGPAEQPGFYKAYVNGSYTDHVDFRTVKPLD